MPFFQVKIAEHILFATYQVGAPSESEALQTLKDSGYDGIMWREDEDHHDMPKPEIEDVTKYVEAEREQSARWAFEAAKKLVAEYDAHHS